MTHDHYAMSFATSQALSMAVIGYSRVSTISQDQRMQVDALKKAGCDFLVSEVGSGAKAGGRPQLQQLIQSLQTGDTLVVWRLDRLARSVKELTEIANQLSEKAVSLRSLTETIDTTTPQGRLIFHFFSMLAQFERDLIVERTKAGLEAAKAQGRTGGRRHLLSSAQVAAARKWIEGGMTQQQAAAALNVSRSTLGRALLARQAQKL